MAVVDGRKYHVVWSCLLLLEIAIQFLTCATHFPTLAKEVLLRIAELLRLFNTRANKLVLGADAMRLTRLKRITAKHLALCSQCLSLVIAELPHIRAAVANHLPTKQVPLLLELDKVTSEFQEHNEKILSKFIDIIDTCVKQMGERLEVANYDTVQPNSAVRELVKSTTTLHTVLHKVLPPEQMHEVFARIFDLFSRRVPLYFTKVSPSTPQGCQRVRDDISHLVEQLGGLEAIQSDCSQLQDDIYKQNKQLGAQM